MKRFQFSAVSLLLVCSFSCTNDPPAAGTGGKSGGTGGSVGSGGNSSGSGGSTSGSGGSTSGSGGSADSGGTTGSGGSTNGSGGATGSGGSADSGGSTGSGGSLTGSGGSGLGGARATGGSAGGSTGSGGATASGGTTGGAGSSGDGFPALDGLLLTFPCGNGSPNFDCPNVGCSGGTSTVTKMYKMGGTAGTTYNVTIHVRGVVEAYNYQGGTRDSGTASINTNKNLFLRGGTQAASGNGNDYNTYELDVSPAVAGETNVYYLNSVIASENPHTSSTTQHLTFAIDYSATFKVPGQGTVTFKSYDSNCRLVQNCGPKASSNSCAAPVSVPLTGAMPAPPASFSQPYQEPTGAHGQWVFFDVTSVTAVP